MKKVAPDCGVSTLEGTLEPVILRKRVALPDLLAGMGMAEGRPSPISGCEAGAVRVREGGRGGREWKSCSSVMTKGVLSVPVSSLAPAPPDPPGREPPPGSLDSLLGCRRAIYPDVVPRELVESVFVVSLARRVSVAAALSTRRSAAVSPLIPYCSCSSNNASSMFCNRPRLSAGCTGSKAVPAASRFEPSPGTSRMSSSSFSSPATGMAAKSLCFRFLRRR